MSPVADACMKETAVLVDKAEIMALLLSRGNDVRAAWVDRQLPDLVDTVANDSLFRMLDIDLATMTPINQPPDPGANAAP